MRRSRTRRTALSRLRTLVLTALLGLLLILVNAVLGGCESDEEPQVYYGPPPVDDARTDASYADATDVPVYYGPMPVDVVEDVAVYYGPQPVDVVGEDGPAVYYGPPPVDVVDEDVPAVYYGPPPVDVSGEDVSIADVPAVYYGPPPADVSGQDVPAVYYGPPPADVSPQDAAADCEPVAWYGPQPCDSDADCVEWYGEGWVCDKDNSFEDPCGQPVNWPTCVEEQPPQ